MSSEGLFDQSKKWEIFTIFLTIELLMEVFPSAGYSVFPNISKHIPLDDMFKWQAGTNLTAIVVCRIDWVLGQGLRG